MPYALQRPYRCSIAMVGELNFDDRPESQPDRRGVMEVLLSEPLLNCGNND